jgi:hypothetical protein
MEVILMTKIPGLPYTIKELAEKYQGLKLNGVGEIIGYFEDHPVPGSFTDPVYGLLMGSNDSKLPKAQLYRIYANPNNHVLLAGFSHITELSEKLFAQVISDIKKKVKRDQDLKDAKEAQAKKEVAPFIKRFPFIDKIELKGNKTIVTLKDGRSSSVELHKSDKPDVRVGILEALVATLIIPVKRKQYMDLTAMLHPMTSQRFSAAGNKPEGMEEVLEALDDLCKTLK